MEHKVSITITTTGPKTEDAVVDVEFTPAVDQTGPVTTVELAASVMLAALSGTSKSPIEAQSQRKGEA